MYTRVFVGLLALALLAFAGALVAIAATGGDDEDGGSAAADVTAVDGEVASCSALRDLQSYRYEIAVSMDDTAPSPTKDPDDPARATSLYALGEALADILSDFTLTGAYENPDRSQATLSFGDDEIELRRIGDESWLRVGDQWEPDEATAEDLLTPVLVCNEVIQAVSPSLVETTEPGRYILDDTKTKNLPPLLGQELRGGYTIDLWVDADEHYPTRLLIESDDPDSDDPAFFLKMDLHDVNAESVEIDRPE